MTSSTKRELRCRRFDINVRRQLVKRQQKKEKTKSIKRFTTPLSFPLAAAMSVGAIQMGETSDEVQVEENGGWVAGRGAPRSLPPGTPPRHKLLFLYLHFADVISRTNTLHVWQWRVKHWGRWWWGGGPTKFFPVAFFFSFCF